MITESLSKYFQSSLDQLAEEIKLYKDEAALWQVKDGITNSGGNLCLHITGGLQHFIGAMLGESGYMRNRDAEFSLKNIPRQKLLEQIETAKAIVVDTVEQLSKNELQKDFPTQLKGETVSTEYFVLHLAGHLNYHLGQINYIRRMLEA
jgi:uncharacterized damage-inducible protein DinB